MNNPNKRFSAVELIAQKRSRQVHTHDHDPKDDIGNELDLTLAGVAYAHYAGEQIDGTLDETAILYSYFPNDHVWEPSKLPHENLIKAAAYLAAAADALLLDDEMDQE